ncbi:MAG: insulinase family protein [Paludibacter sp.]|nr:insulinase family protein [Paludibacter sp.]
MKKGIIQSVLSGVFFLLASGMYAQQSPAVPVDPKVRYGKLDNGLTYYIRANKLPKERAEFYIAQNVGAILENDDQNGLAHFLEHMCFNGTKNFPEKGVINFLEKIGVKFGENINAYTALDQTVYNLSDVPTIRDGIIDSALLVLHDWSGFVTLDGKEIDDERGVIREEWRTRASADRRMWTASNKQKYPGSQYAKRDVIGDTAVINNFKYQTLRDYYKKWYRPDEQAIIVVGDINVDQIESKIKKIFADIAAKPNAGERPIYPIYNNTEPIISIVTDPEARLTRIEVEYKQDKMPSELKKSINGYVVGVINNLISMMLGNRFDEITQDPDAPFVGGYGYYGELVKSKDAFQMLVVPKEGSELEGLKALLLEAEKMKRFGFTNSELERAKSDLLSRMEKAYNDRDNQKNNSYVQEYVGNFLDDEVIPGIEWEYQTLQAVLPRLNAAMVNQLAKSYVTDTNLIVSIMTPEKASVKIPSKDEILKAIADSKTTELTARAEESLDKPLITEIPAPGTIKKITENKEYGTTEWTLNNGVKVIFKPTEFKKDEILMSAYSQGGLSKFATTDLPSATLATGIVGNNGLGEYNQIELNKVLTGKTASASPYISRYTEGFDGNSSVKDFQTMLQLVYLNFTATRKDDKAFQALMNMYKTSLANSETDPRRAFSDSVSSMYYNHSPRLVLMNLKTLEKVDQNKALALFRERFAAPSDFTFLFTGNVNPNDSAMKADVLTYLGGLKSDKVKEKYTDTKIRQPKGNIKNYFGKEMQVKKASNFVLYSGEMPYTIQNQTTMRAIGDILDLRYTENVREKEGGTYGVGVRGSISNTPIDEATLLMQFDSDPDKQQHLIGIIHAEIKKIVDNGPTAEDLDKVKKNLLKKLTEDMEENNWWENAILTYKQDKVDLLKDYKATIEALTPELVQKTLKKLVDQGNVLEVVMKPKAQ